MPSGDAGPALFFLASAAVFMHVAARFVLGSVPVLRSVAVVAAVAAVAAVLAAVGPPTVLALLALVVTGLIAVQVGYEVELRDAVLVVLTYAALTAVVGAVVRAGVRLL